MEKIEIKKNLQKVLEGDGLDISIEYSLKITHKLFSPVTMALAFIKN